MPENVPSPLNTGEPEITPAPPPRIPGQYTRCEFCECKVTRNGEVFEMSEKARGYRDSAEKHRSQVDSLTQQIETLRAEISAKEAEIKALKGTPQRKGVVDALI